MQSIEKLELFATQMHPEPAEEADARRIPLKVVPAGGNGTSVAPCGQVASGSGLPAKQDSLGVTQAVMPGGKTITLLKTNPAVQPSASSPCRPHLPAGNLQTGRDGPYLYGHVPGRAG